MVALLSKLMWLDCRTWCRVDQINGGLISSHSKSYYLSDAVEHYELFYIDYV